MTYVIALAFLFFIVYGIVKAAIGRRYSEMTEEEFEAEAKRSSAMGAAVGSLQKVIDPVHAVEHIEKQRQRIEAVVTNSGDRPETGSAGPAQK